MSLSPNIPKKNTELLNNRTVFVVLILLVNAITLVYLFSNVNMGSFVSTSLSVFTSSNHSVADTNTARMIADVDRVNIRTLEPKGLNSLTTNRLKSTPVDISQKSFKTQNNSSNLTGITRATDLTTTSLPPSISRFFASTVKSGLLELIMIFDKFMTEHNVTYFIYGGSLIGSYRHHGMVPWDDDIDVIVPKDLKGGLRQTFSKVSSNYTLHFGPDCFVKLFPSHGRRIAPYAWSYPFLDIFFYEENATHLWDSCPALRNRYCYPKSMIFPLRRRPFHNLSLWAPRETRAVIDKTYKLDECKSNTYNHSTEYSIKGITVQCTRLYSLHPFVTRANVNGGCNETLMYKGNVTNVFYESDVAC